MSQSETTEEGYGDYVFVFSDTGVGMSKEFTQKVFDTFTRDDKAGIAKIEGTGLGMAIAKSFVELMGGTIRCESELGKGTRFTVNMHMKLVDAGIAEEYEKYQDMSVLIMGEDEQTCENEVKVFEELGIKADYALNIEAASKMLNRAFMDNIGYEFMILNQTEEDKSGIDALTRIARETDLENMTFVLAAKDLFAVKKSYAFDSGISQFVSVPLFRSTVLGIMGRNFELQNDTAGDSVINLEGRRVLLVEDNEMNREIARIMISETQASVYEAANGREAVYAFKKQEPGFFDVILMDVQMPVMNGYEATAAIRSMQREDAATIPIYAMTANTFDEDVRQVREAGMNGHLGKPYVSEELYRILQQAIK